MLSLIKRFIATVARFLGKAKNQRRVLPRRSDPLVPLRGSATSERRHAGDFSEDIVKHYLDTRAYEARGITRDQYVEICRAAWNAKLYDPEYERKVIIDFLQPITLAQLIGADQLSANFLDTPLLQAPVHGFEDKRDIECMVVLTARVPSEMSPDIVQARVSETFRPVEVPLEQTAPAADFYFVALFDVLGFSALVQRIGAQAILGTYQDLIARTILNTNYTGLGRIEFAPGQHTIGGFYAPIDYAYFSDTIILWTPARLTHLSPFLARCGDLICEALKLGLPLRGSITAGEAVMHKATQTYLGMALVEASDIEKNQRWVGATLGVGFAVKDLKEGLNETLVVPLFCEHFKSTMELSIPYLTLDWVRRWRNGTDDLIHLLEEMKASAPDANKAYYENTIAFVRYRELDDDQARAQYLRATTYRVRALGKVNLNAILNRPVVLKVRDEIPHCGFLLIFPDEVVNSSPELKSLTDEGLLFVQRLDYQQFVDQLPASGGAFNLGNSGVVLTVAKQHVEFLDVFNLDPSATKSEGPVDAFEIIE